MPSASPPSGTVPDLPGASAWPPAHQGLSGTDCAIRDALMALGERDPDFLSFRANAKRESAHGLFQYPAMMVPQVQALLIDTVLSVAPSLNRVFDPFAGSGTVLTEAMLRGRDFTGYDINPLAALLCHTKAGPFFEAALRQRSDRLLRTIEADRSDRVDVSFPGRDKWFAPETAAQLSRIRRAVLAETEAWSRRFFWVALATAARLTSRSRMSTFKLHIRPASEEGARALSPTTVFGQAVTANLDFLAQQRHSLRESGLLRSGRYVGSAVVELRDAVTAGEGVAPPSMHDLLVTSPPYGDNHSTVPYGQYSFLSLQWVHLPDIDPELDSSCLATTMEIDRRSLGGSRAGAIDCVDSLRARSGSFGTVADALAQQPRDRLARVAAFCRDLDRTLDGIVASMRPGAYMIWTVGNRRVGGSTVPLERILTELLCYRGAHEVVTLHRRIPSKRMATRNSISATMRSESIVIMRTGVGHVEQ